MNKDKGIPHWLKPDHILFLLLLPIAIGMLFSPTVFFVFFVGIWLFAGIYDLLEVENE